MSWTNAAARNRLAVEKSHSLSLSVRIEDRLHRDIIGATDEAYLVVRPESFKLGTDDVDATFSVPGVQVDTVFGKVFRFDVQASDLNLDPELEWFYGISYVRGGYSMSVLSGDLVVSANPVNIGGSKTFTGGDGVFAAVATVQDRMLVGVTSSMPVPEKGDTGKGTFVTTYPLSEVVGTVDIVPAGTIATHGRALQDGDLLLSSTSKGVLSVVTSRNLSGGGLVSANATVLQAYGLETLKAILDTVPRDVQITTIDYRWFVDKSAAPLPPSYQYHAGDLLFSQAANGLDKYLVVSTVLEDGDTVGAYTGTSHPTTLYVESKIVFPMFSDLDALQARFDAKVDKTATLNGVALNSADVVMSADSVPDGLNKVTMTATERNKLAGIAPYATANASNGYLLNRVNHSGEQPMSTVTGLLAALAGKVASSTVTAVWKGTQASYDQIVVKDPGTLYFIEQG